jgi:ParB family chromosome partitioning protein
MLVKRGLGKGINAIIPMSAPNDGQTVIEADIYKIEPNPNQPRKHFDRAELEGLASSIRECGVIQPLIVQKKDGHYMIVAGERRWRAARLAKLKTVPVVVKEYSNAMIVQIALVENLQRTDLNLIEEAQGYKRLHEDFYLKQDAIAEAVGKSRSHISQVMRLLELDEKIQNYVINKKLSLGHLKLIMPFKSEQTKLDIVDAILNDGLTVRDTEVLVKAYIDEAKDRARIQAENSPTPPPTRKSNTRQYISLENELNTLFNAQVRIVSGKKRGKIEIEYYSNDDLDRLIGLFKTKLV